MADSSPRLVSNQRGRVRDIGNWTTAFFKEPVLGPVWVENRGREGDQHADPRFHGGSEKAVLAYSADHSPAWRAELGLEMPFGAFAENLTIAGLDETSVRLGDVFDRGEARLQVTQPRGPCVKIARRWERRDLTARVVRTGWYLRVLVEGHVESGDPVRLVERLEGTPSVAEALAARLAAR
ncbi:MAG TPA: MOSC domain-containing protein [Vicinamibacteria bacterium]|nr:MOSC domain-containing protein [Vicinamibacteria bacterium]